MNRMPKILTVVICGICGKQFSTDLGSEDAQGCEDSHPKIIDYKPYYVEGDLFPRAIKVTFSDGTKRAFTNFQY